MFCFNNVHEKMSALDFEILSLWINFLCLEFFLSRYHLEKQKLLETKNISGATFFSINVVA